MSKSPLSALVLLGVAGLIGSIAWMIASDDMGATEARVVDLPAAGGGPRVMALTPHERRLQGRLEGAKRELEEYKKRGKVLDNGTIVVPDVDGSPLYIHPKLIEGKGRYGEPLYATAKYKRRAAVPLRELKSAVPDKLKSKVADVRDSAKIGFQKKPSAHDGADGDGPVGPSLSGDTGEGEGGGGKGGKGKGGGSKPGKGG